MDPTDMIPEIYKLIKEGCTPQSAILTLANQYDVNRYEIKENKAINIWEVMVELGFDGDVINFELPMQHGRSK